MTHWTQSSRRLIALVVKHWISRKSLHVCADGQRVGMWRCLLTSGDTSDVDPAAAAAAALQLRKQPPKWAVAVSSGGHFAAAVFSTQPADSTGGARQQPKAQWGQLEAVAHKTFHRYVVR